MTQQLHLVLQMSKNHLAGLAQAAQDPAKKAQLEADLAAVESQLGLIAQGGLSAPQTVTVPAAPGGVLSAEKGAAVRKAVAEGDRTTLLALIGGEQGWAVCPATQKDRAMVVFGSEEAGRKAAQSVVFREYADNARDSGYAEEVGYAFTQKASTSVLEAAIRRGEAAVAGPAKSTDIDWRMVGAIGGVVVVVGIALGAGYVIYDQNYGGKKS